MQEENKTARTPAPYSTALSKYIRGELKAVMPVLRTLARTCKVALKQPVLRILRTIARLALLGQLQAHFLAYLIKETHWDIKDRFLQLHAPLLRPLPFLPDQQGNSMVLYVLLLAYAVKHFLDPHPDLLHRASCICPNFEGVFEGWAKKNSQLLKRINPKAINKVFGDLWSGAREEQANYNLMVDAIIEISPAYNPDKSDRGKLLELELETFVPQSKLEQCKEGPDGSINPVFSSSRLHEMAEVGLGEGGEQLSARPRSSQRYQRGFGGSVFGSCQLLGGGSPVRDQYVQELNLGLQEGQSEENINLLPGTPPSSGLYASRFSSFLLEGFFLFQKEPDFD